MNPNSTNRDKQTEQAPERCHAKKDVHDDGARRADEHGPFAAEAIREQAIYDQAAGIREKRGRDDRSHLRFRKTELRADRLVAQGEVVTAHVKRRVEQADEDPIHAAAAAKTGEMRIGSGRGHTKSESMRFSW